MKSAIILAAGYATRLWPLTKNFPKPLIELKEGKAIIDYVIDSLKKIGIEKFYVVTNDKFYDNFLQRKQKKADNKVIIKILNDGTKTLEDRLGAIGDIKFVLEKENIDEDFMVVCGDNVFDFDLILAKNFFIEKESPVIVAYDVKSFQQAKKFGVLNIDETGKIIEFLEKPENPPSTLISTCVYFFPKKVKDYFRKYFEEGNKADAPGYFLGWLIKKIEVFAKVYDGKWFDIGTFENLDHAKEEF